MPDQRSARAEQALAHLPEADPGLAVLAIWCDMRDAEAARTYVSGDVIHIGCDFASLPLREQIGLLGHLILHVALRHEVSLNRMTARFGGSADPALHNLCSDAVVNELLLRGGHALPRPAVRLADLLKAVLPEEAERPGDFLKVWDEDRLWLWLRDLDAARREALEAYVSRTGFDVDIHPGPADPDAEARGAQWRAHLIRARQAGGAAGRGIGKVLEELPASNSGRTPWEVHLRRLLAKALTQHPPPAYRRPRAAWIARDDHARRTGRPRPAFEPALRRSQQRPRLVVGIDTSGSIGDAALSLFVGEVSGIARRTGAELHVLCFDETVYSRRVAALHDPQAAFRDLRFRRGGGTGFQAVIAEADALDPSAIVLMTDAMGAFGPSPGARVIWACPRPVHMPPPFGTVIELIG